MSDLDSVNEQSRSVYEAFLFLTKIAIVLIAIVLVGMAIFLV